ncbi:hypothetical protein A2311_05270 [candidate division WOR-1 bacterium RIFOXYB2_FULL_48_7]|uniref:Uncharacterized protein n=1 Tax=candidate division WOR-1 bacterium RIFOXYB2_FULL_48_7 TaxID=1802583 RepID=A0A1F4TI37_UNCSA|nr:MAG: hypothetical protein A2311_05270 [candidate division WOR-1 bacterium RIFOXYB2_FULL_48_7]
MPITDFSLRSKIRNYKVIFHDSADFLSTIFKQPNSVCLVDANVWRLYKQTLLREVAKEQLIIVPISEAKKNLLSVQYIYRQLLKRQAKKNLRLVVVGGGIIQDLAGFVASTIYRGIDWVFVPTTMLAQTDSCIGAKTSLNFGTYKNIIGTFFPPLEVHLLTAWLKTLKQVDYLSGLGESVKLQLMGGAKAIQELQMLLPDLLKRELKAARSVIVTSLLIKKGYIEEDEFDRGRRNLLNYGHCFGHALETATKYQVPHGLAVVIGMLLANQVAVARKILKAATAETISRQLLLPILHQQVSLGKLNNQAVIAAMLQDKKRVGDKLPLVMLVDDFRLVKVDDLTKSEALAALTWLSKTGVAK